MLTGDEVPRELQELAADYELQSELGRGGTAVVYLARDRELGRQVAIKVIRARYVTDDEVTARLAREARLLAKLQHPNIVNIYHVRRLSGGSLALVMQHVPGRTLKQAIREGGALPFERAASVLADIAQALAYAHRQGVIHRDVKPENIFLEEGTGRALLSDFGSATARQVDAALTGTGVVVGTPAYMSPEQIDGIAIDGRSDIYSLGLVGWEMLTGLQPWGGDSLLNVLYLQKHRDLPPVDELRPDTPAPLVSAIEGAIEKDPAARWPTAEAFLGELSSSARRPRRRRSLTSAAAVPAPTGATASAETVRFFRPTDARTPTPVPAALPPLAATSSGPRQRLTPAADAAAVPPMPEELQRLRRKPSRSPWRVAVAALLLIAASGLAAWRLVGPDLLRARQQPTLASAPRDERPATTIPVIPQQESAGGVIPQPLFPDSLAPAADSSAAAAEGESPPVDSSLDSAAPADTPLTVAPPPRRETEATARAGTTTARPPAETVRPVPPPAVRDTPRRVPEPTVASTPTPQPRTRPTESPAGTADTPAAGAATAPADEDEESARTGLATRVLRVALGGLHTCALGVDSRAWCWGSNDRGQLGLGRAGRRAGPTRVSANIAFEELAAGTAHTCGLGRDGLAYCWGANDQGQLGDGSTTTRAAPTPVFGGRRYQQLKASIAHTCALTRSGEAWCWGSNASGQLGDGSTSTRLTPVRVSGGRRFTTLAVGWHHSCALDESGQAWCWGRNDDGQLGDSSRTSRLTPIAVRGDLRFTQLAAGAYHTCGLTQRGGVWCWGRNGAGQLGNGTVASSSVPTRAETESRAISIVAGSVHSCALLSGGGALCWGRNNYGQLGDGSTTDRATPTAVASPTGFARLDASGAHTCGTTRDGLSYCWGYNVDGQLGDGTRVNRARPVQVGRGTG